jgi:SAM-dependent methyltransferase
LIDLNHITSNLELREDGLWHSKGQSVISYPEQGNEFCFGIEEGSYWFNHRNECILQALKAYPPIGAFFDIGGGNGYVARAIKDAGYDVVLIEPGYSGALHAQARGVNPVACSTLQDAGFFPGSIQAAGLFDILEHIKDDDGFLIDICNFLVPQGRLYITVPANDYLWSIEDDFAGHYRRYRLSSLVSKLRKLNLALDFATYFFSFLPLPILLLRTLPGKIGLRKSVFFKKENKDLGKEYRMPAGPVGSMLQTMLDFEVKLLQSKHPIPFGSSCLIVARKK